MHVYHAFPISVLWPVLLIGCSHQAAQSEQAKEPKVDAGREMDEKVREAVTGKLRDPASATRNVRKLPLSADAGTTGGPFVYCGEVNLKNAFGGYVGFAQFGVMPIGEDGQTSTIRSA